MDGLLIYGDNFNPESVCPYYLPQSQCTFTWRRDEDGIPVLSGYDPELDLATDWLCECGHYYETAGGCCLRCGNEPPRGWDGDYIDDFEPDPYLDDDWEEYREACDNLGDPK